VRVIDSVDQIVLTVRGTETPNWVLLHPSRIYGLSTEWTPDTRALANPLAFEKQLFTEWIFPHIVGAVIVALRRSPARGLIE
jgi:hypothetical protein